ncbi:MAG: FadR/GntR family transcriptional regulator [Christensenellales bacterium]
MKNNIENVTNNAESNVEQSKDKAYEKVTHYVKERIKTGELRVGDKIPTERELSEKLELSRNSVREALRTMDNMGLIRCRQGSGNYISGEMQQIIEETLYMMFMLKQISDIDVSQLRRAIDIQAMILAVRNVNEDDIYEIKQLLDRLDVIEVDESAFVDRDIHLLISKYSKNKLIEIINDTLSTIMEKFIFKARRLVIGNESDVLTVFHRDMLMSLLERNEGKGVLVINKHYDTIDKYL